MQNGQKCALSTATSARRKKQNDVFLLNEDDEVSPSLLVTKQDVKQCLSASYLKLYTQKTWSQKSCKTWPRCSLALQCYFLTQFENNCFSKDWCMIDLCLTSAWLYLVQFCHGLQGRNRSWLEDPHVAIGKKMVSVKMSLKYQKGFSAGTKISCGHRGCTYTARGACNLHVSHALTLCHVSPLCPVPAPDPSGEASRRIVGMPETRNCHAVSFVLFDGKLPSSGTLWFLSWDVRSCKSA